MADAPLSQALSGNLHKPSRVLCTLPKGSYSLGLPGGPGHLKKPIERSARRIYDAAAVARNCNSAAIRGLVTRLRDALSCVLGIRQLSIFSPLDKKPGEIGDCLSAATHAVPKSKNILRHLPVFRNRHVPTPGSPDPVSTPTSSSGFVRILPLPPLERDRSPPRFFPNPGRRHPPSICPVGTLVVNLQRPAKNTADRAWLLGFFG